MKGLFVRGDLELTGDRAVLGVVGGAGAAAAITGLGFAALFIGSAFLEDPIPTDISHLRFAAELVVFGVYMSLFTFGFALIPWGLGVVCLGGPVWRLMHVQKLRGPGTAVLVGAALPVFGLAFMIYGGSPTARADWLGFVPPVSMIAIPGGVAGWTIWRIAYRPNAGASADSKAA